ncbi:MAG: pantoate--beta-alanine ligase [bacterium]|nr:pantoate--beta-alanine ligase [bacterium]
MEIITSVKEIQKISFCLRAEKKQIGFVPTMGALHQGHISLIKECKKNNDWTIVSIFVNSIQFNDQNDYKNYPRPLDNDLNICQELQVDTVFAPSLKEMYPEEFLTFVNVEKLSSNLCGEYRPGHFEGVATIVTKLFNITNPHRAYFGAKDYQQTQIIKKLVRDLNFDIEIIVLPTIRDENGLALSSRHKYLSQEEKKQTYVLYKSLKKALSLLDKNIKDPKIIIDQINKIIVKEHLANVEYIKICDPVHLSDLKYISNEALIALAVRFEKARLIDSIIWRKN